MRPQTWVIVLAAGDGTRLSALTCDGRGNVVPKQYCSLAGGQTLLQVALRRARRIVPSTRVCVIVARQHEPHWRQLLGSVASDNVIVQPRNRGTANGVLLSVLRILERDALARILFLPSDHYVKEETLLAQSLRATVALLAGDRDGVTLVGIEPDSVDTGLGYIVPGERRGDGSRRVVQFVEKPSAPLAHELIALGAVWNSFIFGAHAKALFALMQERLPEIVCQMTAALDGHTRSDRCTLALDALYERLPEIDFSRAVVQGSESVLRLRTAPSCGWADLGTLQSIARTVQRHRITGTPAPRARTGFAGARIDLSRTLARASLEM